MKQSILALLVFFSAVVAASGNDWKLIKDENGIKVYGKKENRGKFYVIKTVTEAKTNLTALVALLKDADHYTEWMHEAEKSHLLENINQYKFIYYLHSNLPWPAKDRDVVVKTRIKQKNNSVIITRSRNVEGIVDKKADITRIEYLRASWEFTPMDNGKVKIVYKGKFKTHDYLPDWLEQEIYHIAPYHTIKNMRERVKAPKYKNAAINYIKN